MVCPGRGRASAPRLRVVPRVQVAHCPVDLLYADTRRPSSGWRGPSATESMHASLRPPLRPTGDHCAYRVPYNRPASIFPLGPGAPVAALAVSVPLTVLCTPSPLCVCAGRDSPRAGTHRTGNQCGVISPGASHATTRGPRDGSGVHTPSVHRRPPCPWVLASCVGCRLGRCTLVGCRLGRSTLVECRLGRSTLVGCRLGRSTLV